LSKDELRLYICGDMDVYYSERVSVTSPFIPAVTLSLNTVPGTYVKGASLNDSEDTLFLSLWQGGYLGITEFIRTSPTSFTSSSVLPTGAGFTIYPGQLSKDMLYYACGTLTPTSNPKLYVMSRTNSGGSFQGNTFQEILGINNGNSFIGQPTFSSNLRWMAFMIATNNSWQDDDLYIAQLHEGKITGTEEEGPLRNNIIIYPNPASGSIHVMSAIPGKLRVEIFDILGKTLFRNPEFNPALSNEIYLSGLSKGAYIIMIEDEHHSVNFEQVIIE
jgi:hypothetical protein